MSKEAAKSDRLLSTDRLERFLDQHEEVNES